MTYRRFAATIVGTPYLAIMVSVFLMGRILERVGTWLAESWDEFLRSVRA